MNSKRKCLIELCEQEPLPNSNYCLEHLPSRNQGSFVLKYQFQVDDEEQQNPQEDDDSEAENNVED